MAVLTMVGVVWKGANKTGAAASMFTGFVTACIWYALGQPAGIYAALPAIIVSFVTLVVVSKMTAPVSPEIIEQFFPKGTDEQ